jgi:hypothetical protein
MLYFHFTTNRDSLIILRFCWFHWYKSIPQIGQDPGPSCIISGCMGKYTWLWSIPNQAFTKSIPQTGQSPALSYTLAPRNA